MVASLVSTETNFPDVDCKNLTMSNAASVVTESSVSRYIEQEALRSLASTPIPSRAQVKCQRGRSFTKFGQVEIGYIVGEDSLLDLTGKEWFKSALTCTVCLFGSLSF